ncbi:MAG TPA: phosphate ABC transporter substrate-binding protein PstS [Gemmatimonadales bacterium]|nr:phosphate ABC transporter substrate-binding protein PstS [Gemmatimonadales bacterium]
MIASRARLRPALTALLTATVAACGGGGDRPGGAAAATSLTGAGATFPYPLYSRWFDSYRTATGVAINYQSIGSGGGIRQFSEGTVDFGATDGPMNDEQIAALQGNVAHLPTAIGAVVLTYNLPALGTTPLVLDGAAVADIFLGRITRWDDARLAALNPGVRLPAAEVVVVHRSDGSGTTFVFVDYLSKVSPDWRAQVGRATSVNWPVGLGGKGNEGVTQQVRQLEGAIGYVELIYATSNQLQYATMTNRSGTPVVPSLASSTAAAAGAEFAAETDFRVSITDSPDPAAYPIASFTWLLVKTDNPDPAKGRSIRDFLRWMVGPEAQGVATELGYAPLPPRVAELVTARIATLAGGGAPIPNR